MYYCGVDHLLARVRRSVLVTLTEGTGGAIGEEVAELVRRDASAEVDRYCAVPAGRVSEALSGITADIAVYLLYLRHVTFGSYSETTTATVTNNTTDARSATTSFDKTTEDNIVSLSQTVTTIPGDTETISTSETTTQVAAPQQTVSNNVTVIPANTTVQTTYSPSGPGTANNTGAENSTTIVSDSLARTGTVTTGTVAGKTITEIPSSVVSRYEKALDILRNPANHARLLGLRTNVFRLTPMPEVEVLNGFA